jgi:hypothetical protein
MIGRRAQENIVVVLIMLVLIGVVVVSLDYGPRARMVPIPVAVFGLVLAVVQLVWQNLLPTEELHVDLLAVLTRQKEIPVAEADAAGKGVQASGTGAHTRWRREVVAYGMVLLFLSMVWLMGPVPSIFLFTTGYFLVSRQYWAWRSIAYALLFTLGVYAVFVYALDIQLYHGVLEPVVDRFR